MMMHIQALTSLLVAAFVMTPFAAPEARADDARFAAADVRSDFDAWLEFTRSTHPDLGYTTDMDAFEARAAEIRAGLTRDMTAREIWAAFSLLNSLFDDAHVGMRHPETAYQAYLDGGGAAFPLPVELRRDGALRIAATAPSVDGLSPGDEIISINGRAADDIVAAILPHIRGESDVIRRFVLERYFAPYFWAYYGDARSYGIRARGPDGKRRFARLRAAPDGASASPAPFAYRSLGDAIGLMRIDTFVREREAEFDGFLNEAFTQIRADGVQDLIIDLRMNGGGAHDLSDLLADYLTMERFTPISKVVARITPENQARIPGSTLGDVVTVPFSQWFTPSEDKPLRFDGKAYVLIGARTYSQAIAFAATAQDFGFAEIVGEATHGRANQTGQVQMTALPHTGLRVQAPIYVFVRTSGEGPGGVVPDISIQDDPRDANASVDGLVSMIKAARQD